MSNVYQHYRYGALAMFSYKSYSNSILNQLPANRLLALDVFRGITITVMILVNNPGSWSYVYAPMAHADWHGWTPTDLIFPFFIFIVGVAISLSVNVMLKKGATKADVVKTSAIRMLKLLLLGWFLTLFYFNFSVENYDWLEQKLYSIRIMGVLQRIGLVYFICVLAYLFLSRRNFYLLAPLLLLLYTGLMLFVPYSDSIGNTYVGLLDKGNNLAAWIDHTVLTATHVYQKDNVLFSYDPEGLLSTLPAIVTCISGAAVGQYLMLAKDKDLPLIQQIKRIAVVGAFLTLFGLLLDLAFPINKILWSPSYVSLTSGIAMLSLALCFYLIDYLKFKSWTSPFIVFGANSIAFFMFAGVVGRLVIMIPMGETSLKGFIFSSVYQPIFGNYSGSLAYAISFLALSYVVFHVMYKRNIIWKV